MSKNAWRSESDEEQADEQSLRKVREELRWRRAILLVIGNGLGFGGLAVVGYGLYLVYSPLAYVWIGIWMFLIGWAIDHDLRSKDNIRGQSGRR